MVLLVGLTLSACGLGGPPDATSLAATQQAAALAAAKQAGAKQAPQTKSGTGSGTGSSNAAPAAPPSPKVSGARVFANCAELNGTYPHGVGLPGAVDLVSSGGVGVTTFTRDAPVYNANPGRDGDKDGIACEKK